MQLSVFITDCMQFKFVLEKRVNFKVMFQTKMISGESQAFLQQLWREVRVGGGVTVTIQVETQ